MLKFEWDPVKAKSNHKKHQVAFKEAATVFRDPMSITFYDPDQSDAKRSLHNHWISTTGQLLMVAHTERSYILRLVSVRELTRAERQTYEEEINRRKK